MEKMSKWFWKTTVLSTIAAIIVSGGVFLIRLKTYSETPLGGPTYIFAAMTIMFFFFSFAATIRLVSADKLFVAVRDIITEKSAAEQIPLGEKLDGHIKRLKTIVKNGCNKAERLEKLRNADKEELECTERNLVIAKTAISTLHAYLIDAVLQLSKIVDQVWSSRNKGKTGFTLDDQQAELLRQNTGFIALQVLPYLTEDETNIILKTYWSDPDLMDETLRFKAFKKDSLLTKSLRQWAQGLRQQQGEGDTLPKFQQTRDLCEPFSTEPPAGEHQVGDVYRLLLRKAWSYCSGKKTYNADPWSVCLGQLEIAIKIHPEKADEIKEPQGLIKSFDAVETFAKANLSQFDQNSWSNAREQLETIYAAAQTVLIHS